MAGKQHWAHIAESGTTLGMGILLAAYRIGGRLLFQVFVLPVICFYFLFRPNARKAIQQFRQRAALSSGVAIGTGWAQSFANFWQFGLVLIDKFAVWMGDITKQDVVLHNGDIIDQLLARQQGAVILISHLGNFEICQALSRDRKGLKLTALHHTKNAEKFNRLLGRYSSGRGIELLQVTEMSAATAVQMSEKIDSGEFIAIAGDRVPIANAEATLPIEFMGEVANFPKGAFALSTALAVPVLMVVCLKKKGVYHIYFEYLSQGERVSRRDRSAAILDLGHKYAGRLEYFALKVPGQWFNFYNFWTRS